MNSILIVDDEPRVLQGLRRMLRGMRGEWHIEFAEGGIEALKMLFDFPFDVVLSDMRMPNIDGAELLTEIRRLCPETVRIILSGQCDDDTVLKCVEPAHQFLAKPCDSSMIKETVRSACSLRKRLSDPLLQKLTSRITSIPSLAGSYGRLMETLASPSPALHRIEEIIARDVGMTAKIMQLVSSSFFGTPRRTIGIHEAVRRLGVTRVKLLATQSTCLSPAEPLSPEEDAALTTWRDHSLLVADRAYALASAAHADPVVCSHAYLSGMLHGLSTFILRASGDELQDTSPHPDGLAPCSPAFSFSPGGPDFSEAFPAINAEVTSCLLALWGLPESIVEAVSHFQRPSRGGSRVFSPLTALHIAHGVTGPCGAEPPSRQAIRDTLDWEYLRAIDSLAGSFEGWLDTWTDLPWNPRDGGGL